MKTNPPFLGLVVVLGMLVQPLFADLYITNFSTVNSSSANGVWRNDTAGSDLSIPVSLSQSGAAINLVTDPDGDPSEIDGGFFWWDDPFSGTELFNSDTVDQFMGDYILIEVGGGGNSSVVIDFGAEIVNPILHFTDVDTQTTLTFSTANPTKIAGLGNMMVSGNTVKTTGVQTPLLTGTTEETLGSIQFTGTFTTLEFTITNDGSDPVNDEDRTGFVVTTETAPAPISSGPSPTVSVDVNNNVLTIDWGTVGAIDELLMLDDSWNWVMVPGSDPANSSSFVGSTATFGPTRLFRGSYTP